MEFLKDYKSYTNTALKATTVLEFRKVIIKLIMKRIEMKTIQEKRVDILFHATLWRGGRHTALEKPPSMTSALSKDRREMLHGTN